MDSHKLKNFMHQLTASVDKIDELLTIYDEIDSSMAGGGGGRLHAVIEKSVKLASQMKGGANITIGTVGTWLERQHHQLDHEENMLQELDCAYSDVRPPFADDLFDDVLQFCKYVP